MNYIVIVLIMIIGINCTPHKVNLLSNLEITNDTIIFQVSNIIKGPIKLIIDDVNIPIQQECNKKRYTKIIITGLSYGTHEIALLSSSELFGPSRLSVELNSVHGEYIILLSRPYKFNITTNTPISKNNVSNGIKASFQP